MKIGLVGSLSSHALAFARLCNLPDEQGNLRFPGCAITHIYGTEAERTRFVAQEGLIPTIVSSPDEMLGAVDAVMVLFRDGKDHLLYALPFIDHGIATWVDKPFAVSYTEAETMVRHAARHNTFLSGGSTLRYCPAVLNIKDAVQNMQLISANFNFPGEPYGIYSGIYFYGGHTAEILTTAFGNPLAVRSDLFQGNLISLFRFERYAVSVNFAEVQQFSAQLYSRDKCLSLPLDISNAYLHGFTAFINDYQAGKAPKSDILLRPVRILNALEQSIRSGEDVQIE